MPSSEEDGRKKRQVHPMTKETPKKVRVDAAAEQKGRLNPATSTKTSRKVPPPARTNVASKPKPAPASKKPLTSKPSSPSSPSFRLERIRNMWKDKNRRVWDLEGALLYLVEELDEKEYLTNDESNWVTFRVGHAGDASKIAGWYRLAKQQQQVWEQEAREEEQLEEEDPEIETGLSAQVEEVNEGESNASTGANMLEVWLADGFGDDRRLPFVYSLVANVHHIPKAPAIKDVKTSSPTSSRKEKKDKDTAKGETKGKENADIPSGDLKKSAVTKEFGAIALLTTGFDETLEKVLKIEWMGLNPDLPNEVLTVLRQRLWLRLSTLSVMTACQGGIEWDQRFSLDPLKREQEQEQKKKQQKKAMNESDKEPPATVSPRAE